MSHIEVVCELRVIFVQADGRQLPGRIWIGRPEPIDDHEAICAVGLDGLRELPAMHAADALQALLLGVRLIASLLADFISKGGSVLRADGQPLELEAYFGMLLRPPGAS